MARPLTALSLEADTLTQIASLRQSVLIGLVSMFDPERKLFCHRLRQGESGLVREGISHRYTMIALLGLQRLRASGVSVPLDLPSILQALIKDTRWLENVGDLGLLVWLCALVSPERLAEIDSQFDLKHALVQFHETRRGRTMELSWFLSGLAHQKLACPNLLPHLRDTAMETYQLLKKNQGEHGVFSHLAENGGLTGWMRGRMGSFADQVYPIYALAKFSKAYEVPKAAERAMDTALTLCELQGPYGQWWWHYDATSGKVLGQYPVYSVHQYGIAPMALLALGEETQSDFTHWIYKGLRWIRGDNELEQDMRDSSANVVWRYIYRNDYKKHWDVALAVLMARGDEERHKELAVRHECRPYELGWLLYAFASYRTEEKGSANTAPVIEGRLSESIQQ
jgi:hypothetical protein